MRQQHILIIEDDLKLAALTAEYLENQGFKVSQHHTGDAAVEKILELRPDLVILDIMLPVKDGTIICREVRDRYLGGILMLTARDDDMDELLGLELGADDYIGKPVQPRLLLARIHSLLRRIGTQQPAVLSALEVGGLRLDVTAREVRLDGELLEVTDAEFDLLVLLARHAGEVVSRDVIVQNLRGIEYDGLDRSVDNRISRLRRKLPEKTITIKTVRARGYMLALPSEDA